MHTTKLTVSSADGARTEATVFVAADAAPKDLVVSLPAIGVAAHHYEGLARALAERGVCAVTVDVRGLGASSVRARRGVDFGYRELLEWDLPAIVSAARAAHPAARLVLLGHSLGAHLGSMYASVHPGEVAALVFVAAGTSYYRSWQFPRRVGMLAIARAVRGVSAAAGYFPGRALGLFGNEARRFMREWAALTTRGRFEVTGGAYDYDARLATLTLPILAFSFEGDTFAPTAAVRHLLRKMPRADVTEVRWSAADLDAPAVDHFRWARYPGHVAARVAQWLGA